MAFAEGCLKVVGGTGSNSLGALAVEVADKLQTEELSRFAEIAGALP